MKKATISFISVMCLFSSIGLIVRNINLASSQIALVRGIVGSLFLLIASMVSKRNISWKAIKPNSLLLLASGTAIGFNWMFLFEAYKHTSIANATLSYYFAPVFVTLLSAPILKEKLSLPKILSVIAALLGMFLIVGSSQSSPQTNHIVGIGYGLLAAILYASVILMNKFISDLSGLESTVVQLGTASSVLLPYVMTTAGFNLAVLDTKSLILLLVVGVIHTGFAYLVYFSSMQELPGQTIAVLSYIDPLSAILMSSIFLRESLSARQIFGGLLILGATFTSEYYANKYVKGNIRNL